MPVYHVIRKSDGAHVTGYAAAVMLLDQYPLADYDHVEVPDAPPEPSTVYGGRRILSKLELRRLFPDAVRHYVDEFNAGFDSHPALTVDQKRAIRSALEDYRVATEISLDDPAISMMIGLYQQLGLLTAEQAQGILNG